MPFSYEKCIQKSVVRFGSVFHIVYFDSIHLQTIPKTSKIQAEFWDGCALVRDPT